MSKLNLGACGDQEYYTNGLLQQSQQSQLNQVGWNNLPIASGQITSRQILGGYIPTSGYSSVNTDWSIPIDNDLIDFMDMMLLLLGYEISFKDYQSMSEKEKKGFKRQMIRDIKLNKLV